MTPLYDVLTAQPSLDAGQIQAKQFRLAMAIGTSRHYRLDSVMPRHFLQTAALAGIGNTAMRALFADLAEGVDSRLDAVIAALPAGFPEALVASVAGGLRRRGRLLESPLDA
jgi:serine/threonine-protein kinase HipA